MALNQLQDFYKQTIITPCGAGAGNIYVSALPVPTSGYLVISPSNQALREVVRYTGVGTDGGGAYITIANVSDRGLGGTTAQSHAIGESIRMNITAEHWADLIAELVGFAPVNNPTFTGVVTVPAPVNPTDAARKDYVDALLGAKADLAGNNLFSGLNVFTGANQFTQSPTIPDALLASQPVTLAQLLAASLAGVSAGLEYFDVSYRADGKARSIHDNVAGKTYVFEYASNGNLKAICSGSQRWVVNESGSKITSVVR